jgi:murein DD-endopeptidase MepM/ murein hydrolase activator NlpD
MPSRCPPRLRPASKGGCGLAPGFLGRRSPAERYASHAACVYFSPRTVLTPPWSRYARYACTSRHRATKRTGLPEARADRPPSMQAVTVARFTAAGPPRGRRRARRDNARAPQLPRTVTRLHQLRIKPHPPRPVRTPPPYGPPMLLVTTVLLAAAATALPTPAVVWRRPVPGAVTRAFAYGPDPFRRGWHRGVDLAAAPGSVVRAACTGQVVTASDGGGVGAGVVTLRCGPWRVTHLPLASVTVQAGARIRAGSRVGTLARSAAHAGLHLGVRRADDRFAYVDPVPFLPEAKTRRGPPPALPLARRVPPETVPEPRAVPRERQPRRTAPRTAPRGVPAPHAAPRALPAPRLAPRRLLVREAAPRPRVVPHAAPRALPAPRLAPRRLLVRGAAPRARVVPHAAPRALPAQQVAPRGQPAPRAPGERVRVPAGDAVRTLAPWPAWIGLALMLCGAAGGGVRMRVRVRRATRAAALREGVG